MLRTAATGAPLVWAFECHRQYPAPFRAHARAVLIAVMATPVGRLPLGVRDEIVGQVMAALARKLVWPMMNKAAWQAALAARAHVEEALAAAQHRRVMLDNGLPRFSAAGAA